MSSTGLLSNKEIVDAFFKKQEGSDCVFVCRCGRKRQQKSKTGYQNLMDHIRSAHPDYKEVIAANYSRNPTFFVSKKAAKVFGWVECIITSNLPFSWCEQDSAKRFSKFEAISRPTLMKYVDLLTRSVEEKIREELPAKFGIVFDGWTCGSTHYACIYAVYMKDDQFIERLLAFSPFIDETSLSSDAYVELFDYVLTLFGKARSNITDFVADNCSVNKKISQLCQIPLIGCASHRWNLELSCYFSTYEPMLDRINSVMKKLSTLKGGAKLRQETRLTPVMRVPTRWSSNHDMVSRYKELLPALTKIDDREINSLLLSPGELETLKDISKKLEDFNSVTLQLQRSQCTMLEARNIFDSCLEDFPEMGKYIRQDSNIVCSADFENAVIKVQRNKENPFLSLAEQQALKICLQEKTVNENEEGLTYAERALKRAKQSSSAEYLVDHIRPTSNVCERQFSVAGNVATSNRAQMTPVTLEETLFLKKNRDLWDLQLVSDIVNTN